MVAGRIMTPPNVVHILIPAACEHDVFHCIEDKIRLPYKEKILDYPDGPNVITRVLKSKKSRRENQRKRCSDGSRVRECCVANFEDEGRRPQSKECWWSLEARKAKKQIPSYNLQEGTQPFQDLDFCPMRLILDFCITEI